MSTSVREGFTYRRLFRTYIDGWLPEERISLFIFYVCISNKATVFRQAPIHIYVGFHVLFQAISR